MTQAERREYLIQKLIDEQPQYQGLAVPQSEAGQKQLLRSLMNVRPPRPVEEDFFIVQDQYLQAETAAKGITDAAALPPAEPGIFLWRGDITTLRCDAIVNAANSGMTGCYQPCHNCIDNCIHTYAGIQLRLACADMMEKQGFAEPVGRARITPAYNLPCRYILHTVGPIVQGSLTKRHCDLLASCYRSCLELADKNHIRNIAFCCISTGVFRFPNDKAAEIAVQTVREYRARTGSRIEVIFNVFKEQDEQIYQKLLGQN